MAEPTDSSCDVLVVGSGPCGSAVACRVRELVPTARIAVVDAALLDALTGRIAPRGRLPVELPRSMDAVRASRPDVPSDTADPLYPYGAGLAC